MENRGAGKTRSSGIFADRGKSQGKVHISRREDPRNELCPDQPQEAMSGGAIPQTIIPPVPLRRAATNIPHGPKINKQTSVDHTGLKEHNEIVKSLTDRVETLLKSETRLREENKRMRKEVKDLAKNYARKQDEASLRYEAKIETLSATTENLKGKLEKTYTERDENQKRFKAIVSQNKDLNDRAQALSQETLLYRNRNNTYVLENKSLKEKVESLDITVTNLQNSFDKLEKEREGGEFKAEVSLLRERCSEYQKRIGGLSATCDELGRDNEELRKIIVQRTETHEPVSCDAETNIQDFEMFATDTEMWVAKQAKANKGAEIQEEKLIELLSESGECGKASAEFLGEKLDHITPVWYRNARSRHQLIRHIVAVYLFDLVFHPFVVGTRPELVKTLSWIEEDIMAHGMSAWR